MSNRPSIWMLIDRLTMLVTLVAGVAVLWMVFTRVISPARAANAAAAVEAVHGQTASVGRNTLGAESAPIALIEFSDFECPFCGRYARETFAKIQQDYVTTGKVRYAFRNFPLTTIHPQASKAADAGECAADGGKFWAMHDRLFSLGGLTEPELLKHAAAIQLDDRAFQNCLNATSHRGVNDDQAEATRLQVVSTPTFLLGRLHADGTVAVVTKISGAQDYKTFKQAIDSALQSAQR